MDPSGGPPALKSRNLDDIPASIAAKAAVREALSRNREPPCPPNVFVRTLGLDVICVNSANCPRLLPPSAHFTSRLRGGILPLRYPPSRRGARRDGAVEAER